MVDGLGVGTVDSADGWSLDPDANTLRSVLRETGPRVDTLDALGLPKLGYGPTEYRGLPLSTGWITPHYPGADTALGHLELLGCHPNARPATVAAQMPAIVAACAPHHEVEVRDGYLIVDRSIHIFDNVESNPGSNVNVLAAAGETSPGRLLTVGRMVRSAVSNPRVIVMSGRPLTGEAIRASIDVRQAEDGLVLVGTSISALGIHNEHYRSTHLTGNLAEATLATEMVRSGHEVVLLGKAADLIAAPGATVIRATDTSTALEQLADVARERVNGLLICNIFQLDLAGHGQDPDLAGEVLRTVDHYLGPILATLRPGDHLVLTADHGNDPAIGHGRHTREHVPLICVNGAADAESHLIGHRHSLADVAASICSWHSLTWRGAGRVL
ncbi:hypothetical protein ACIBQ6_34855 [Nonomuraea sp. NPDC049655]|uniref:hypothetical protein n=1 Tax=Nonomuraea sp. NPDC049655 TaxID=3364355 RepID=UPI003797B351